MRGTGWDPEYYSSGVQISFDQNFGNGVLTRYADDMTVKPGQDGRFSFDHTIPKNFGRGDVLSISGLIGNGSGERANFTVIGDGREGSGPSGGPDLQPTAITYDPADVRLNTSVHFDSGIRNSGAQGSRTFNIKWFVDGKEVGAYGGHEGISAGADVANGNSQFDWTFPTPGHYSVEFAVDVDNQVSEVNEDNNSTSVAVNVVAPTNNGGSEAPTWKTYLDYLDDLASAGSNAESGVSCGRGVANPKDPSYILGCLGIIANSNPAAEAILNVAGCGLGANIPACLGTSLDGLRAIVFAIRQAARIDPNLAAFLETRMW